MEIKKEIVVSYVVINNVAQFTLNDKKINYPVSIMNGLIEHYKGRLTFVENKDQSFIDQQKQQFKDDNEANKTIYNLNRIDNAYVNALNIVKNKIEVSKDILNLCHVIIDNKESINATFDSNITRHGKITSLSDNSNRLKCEIVAYGLHYNFYRKDDIVEFQRLGVKTDLINLDFKKW